VRIETMTLEQKRAYVLADNKLAMNAGWDEELLAEELKGLLEIDLDFDIGVTGLSIPEIDRLIDGIATEEPGNTPEHGEVRYSPAVCMGARIAGVSGNPDYAHVSTSYVERQNLTMRMGMRRFTRLTNAFSKKAENHEAAIALHYMYYNFARIHQTLRVTPAMEAGVADHVWTLEEIIGLL
jgi:hypothetical protein